MLQSRHHRRSVHWIAHIGAHKTATTHIQDSLAQARESLAQRGVMYLTRATYRGRLERGLDMVGSPRRNAVNLWRMRRQLLREARGCSRIVISEENLLGRPMEALDDPPYPELELGLRLLCRLRGEGALTVCMAIRRFDELAAGAYSTALRFGTPPEGLKADFAHRAGGQPPRWSDIIERVIRALPGDAVLKVWRYEDYGAHRPEILRLLVGPALPAIPDIARPGGTVTPSFHAVERAERLRRESDATTRISTAAVDAIYRDAPASGAGERYTFLGDRERRILAEAYEADLDYIGKRWPDVLDCGFPRN